MEGTLRCTLGSQTQHAHSLEDHTRFILQSTSTYTKHFHNISNKIATTPKHMANCFTKQFTYIHYQTRNRQDKQIHQQRNT